MYFTGGADPTKCIDFNGAGPIDDITDDSSELDREWALWLLDLGIRVGAAVRRTEEGSCGEDEDEY